jgi:hypothetical protein
MIEKVQCGCFANATRCASDQSNLAHNQILFNSAPHEELHKQKRLNIKPSSKNELVSYHTDRYVTLEYERHLHDWAFLLKIVGRDEFLISLCKHDVLGHAGDSYVRYSLMGKGVTHHDTGVWNCILGSAGLRL